MNRLFTLATIFFMGSASLSGQSALEPPAKEAAPYPSTMAILKKVANWQLDHWKKQGMRGPAYDWVNAVGYTGLSALARVSGDSAYYRALHDIGEGLGWNTGPHRTMADDYCIGQLYTELYRVYRDPRMLAHFRAQCDTICSLPHTESLEWKNDSYLREWAWCDALFMGPPGLAALSAVTGDRRYLTTAVNLWWNTTGYLFDQHGEHLYYRDSRYFTKREANGQKMFWARGNGWALAGLVRLLANMPRDHPGRAKLIQFYRQMVARVAALQQPDGAWRASLLDPDHYPGKETSGTALFCYAIAWGVHHGILRNDPYRKVALDAWDALKRVVHPDGMLGFVQPVGEQPGMAGENSTEAYGTGAFLLAGSEILLIEK